MIYLIVARNEDGDDRFNDYLNISLKEHVNDIKYMEIFNHHVLKSNSIFSKYNAAMAEFVDIKDDDYFIFCHADTQLLDKNIVPKINMIFQHRLDIGIVGVIGTKVFGTEGGWWSNDPSNHIGQITQGLEDGSKYQMIKKIGFFPDAVCVDGSFFCVRGSLFNKGLRFDESTYPNSYHFYDADICLSVLEMGMKVAVADIEIFHASVGPLSESWQINRQRFINKWQQKGYNFPLKASDIVSVINI